MSLKVKIERDGKTKTIEINRGSQNMYTDLCTKLKQIYGDSFEPRIVYEGQNIFTLSALKEAIFKTINSKKMYLELKIEQRTEEDKKEEEEQIKNEEEIRSHVKVRQTKEVANEIAKEDAKKEEPKIEEPKKEEPKIEEPKKEEDKKEEPKIEEPKKEEPKKEEDKKEEPKKEEPKIEEDKKEEPKKDISMANIDTVCPKCGKVGEFGIRFRNCLYHKSCFVCSICSKSLTTFKQIRNIKGEPICEDCFEDNCMKCEKCKKPMKESYVEVNGITLHEHCLTCEKCSTPLINMKIKMRDNLFYCVDCYMQLIKH